MHSIFDTFIPWGMMVSSQPHSKVTGGIRQPGALAKRYFMVAIPGVPFERVLMFCRVVSVGITRVGILIIIRLSLYQYLLFDLLHIVHLLIFCRNRI